MRVWDYSEEGGNRRRRYGAVWMVPAIVLAMTAMTACSAMLSFLLPAGAAREASLTAGCMVTVLLGVWASVRAGRRLRGYAGVFCKDEEDRLYVADAGQYVGFGHGITGYAAMEYRTQKRQEEMLEQMAAGILPPEAAQILQVENIRDLGDSYMLACRVRYGNGGAQRRVCFLMKGHEGEQELLWELERRKDRTADRGQENKRTYITAALLAFIAVTGVCVMSHAAVGYLPQEIYFPCLGLDFILFCILCSLIIKWRRGE